MDQQDHLPGKHPHRGIFASLIVAIILMVGIFGLFVYSVFLAPEPDEPAVSELEQAIEDSILEEIKEAVAEEEETTDKVSSRHFESFVAFDYPADWHVASIADLSEELDGQSRDIIIASPNPVSYPSFGPPYVLDILRFNNETGDFREFSSLTEMFTNDLTYEFLNTELEVITLNEFEVTRIFGDFNDGPHPGPIDVIIFEGEQSSIYVRHHGLINDPDWELIKNSLDFTNIQ
jgi:hypothetical protein